jgi:hypothetical protein
VSAPHSAARPTVARANDGINRAAHRDQPGNARSSRHADYSSNRLGRGLKLPDAEGDRRRDQGDRGGEWTASPAHRASREKSARTPAPPLFPMRWTPDPPSFAWRPDPATVGVVAVFRPALDIVAWPPYVTVAVPVPMSRLPHHRSTGWRRDNFRARRRDRRVGGRWRRLSTRAAYPNHADSRTDKKPLHRQSPQSIPRDATPTRNLKWLIVTAGSDVRNLRSMRFRRRAGKRYRPQMRRPHQLRILPDRSGIYSPSAAASTPPCEPTRRPEPLDRWCPWHPGSASPTASDTIAIVFAVNCLHTHPRTERQRSPAHTDPARKIRRLRADPSPRTHRPR